MKKTTFLYVLIIILIGILVIMIANKDTTISNTTEINKVDSLENVIKYKLSIIDSLSISLDTAYAKIIVLKQKDSIRLISITHIIKTYETQHHLVHVSNDNELDSIIRANL